MSVQRLPDDGWLVTSYDAVSRVLRDARTFTVDDPRFSTDRLTGPSMLSTDGPEHSRHRRAFTEPFLPRGVEERFGVGVRRHARELVESLRDAGGADLRQAVAAPLAARVMVDALGVPGADLDEVLSWYDAMVAAVEHITATDVVPEEGRRAFGRIAAGVRTPYPRSVLERAHESLAAPEVAANAAVIMFGGIDTTEGMISFALRHLLADAAWVENAAADEAWLALAVEESLRLEPAAGLLDRYATMDVELAGTRILRGELVRLDLRAANRDPAVFVDPDRFVPERADLRRHLSFAVGPHVCLGMDLARLETRAAVGAVVRGLPGLRLVPDEAGAAATEGTVFRKPVSVRASWTAPGPGAGSGVPGR